MKRKIWIAGAALAILVMVSIAIALKTKHPTANTKQPTVEITNQTSSLQVVSSKIEGDSLIIDLQHVGVKPMIAYLFQYGDMYSGVGNRTSIFLDPWQRGDKMRTYIPLKNFPAGDVLKVDLAVCTFEDLSSEGDWSLADRERGEFEGEALAYQSMRETTAIDGATMNSLLSIKSRLDAARRIKPAGLNTYQQVGFKNGMDAVEASIKTAMQSAQNGSREAHAPFFEKEMLRASRIAQNIGARIELRKGGIDK